MYNAQRWAIRTGDRTVLWVALHWGRLYLQVVPGPTAVVPVAAMVWIEGEETPPEETPQEETWRQAKDGSGAMAKTRAAEKDAEQPTRGAGQSIGRLENAAHAAAREETWMTRDLLWRDTTVS